MNQQVIQIISTELKVKPQQVAAAIELLNSGATVPFIARYRKEATQGLDDVQLRDLETRFQYLTSLNDRKQTILASIEAQQKLTPELQAQIEACFNKTELEDLYNPYKITRNSRANKAKEAGLEPLAQMLLQDLNLEPGLVAEDFLNPEHNINSAEDALTGARDILIEHFSQQPGLVAQLRENLWQQGLVLASVIEEQQEAGQKFKDYFDYQEPIRQIPSHRALALFRGEQEGVLKVKLELESALETPPTQHPFLAQIREFHQLDFAGKASESFFSQTLYQAWRLRLAKSLENDLFTRLREKSEAVAIEVFAKNLQDLLLASPAGAKTTLALDPGFRTGVKLAIVDPTGKLLATDNLFPHQPQNQWQKSKQQLAAWVQQHDVELISIGNGTASRETEQLVAETIKDFGLSNLQKIVVSEAGASVYSASEIAQQEFPELDVALRGGISIARRLQDPLAELVKIDPKAIGVGQYQHDVNQVDLSKSLQATVEDCVNKVGVDLNTASAPLLSYVSGLSSRLAQEIVNWRDQNGAFSSRKQLTKVPRLGPKAFEQSAGFLRIRDAKHPLDQSAVHPESYPIVEQMAASIKVDLAKLIGNSELISQIKLKDFVTEQVGLPTLQDIVAELEKPGRDPRPDFKTANFDAAITEISDLEPGLVLEGVVSNVTHFGAFVDIGVHQDGLVHISHLADKFVADPHEVVKAGQIVKVRVLEVDAARKRISLSLRLDAKSDAKSSGSTADKSTGKIQRNHKNNQRNQAPAGLNSLAAQLAKLKSSSAN